MSRWLSVLALICRWREITLGGPQSHCTRFMKYHTRRIATTIVRSGVKGSDSDGEVIGLHIVAHTCGLQADALERDASEVLRLDQSKNSFVPINRIPPDFLSLTPYFEDELDRDTAEFVVAGGTSSHPRSSLRTQLDLAHVGKTRAYIQRSQSSPLKTCYLAIQSSRRCVPSGNIPYPSNQIAVNVFSLPGVPGNFYCHPPLPEKLDINATAGDDTTFDSSTDGVITPPSHKPKIVFPQKRQLKSSTSLGSHPYAICHRFSLSAQIHHIQSSDVILSSPHSHRASLIFGLLLSRWGSQLLDHLLERSLISATSLMSARSIFEMEVNTTYWVKPELPCACWVARLEGFLFVYYWPPNSPLPRPPNPLGDPTIKDLLLRTSEANYSRRIPDYLGDHSQRVDVFELRDHVTRVVYRAKNLGP